VKHLADIGPVGAVTAVCAVLLASCGTTSVDSGGLSANDRDAAQGVLNTLHGSNIATQLVGISETVQELPAACRVHVVSGNPTKLKVYVFWIPYTGGNNYTWLNMTLTPNPSDDTFHLGAAHPVLPGGQLNPDGQGVNPYSVDTTVLSAYGRQQRIRNHAMLIAHAGDTLSAPGANCQVLRNGDLRLLPNQPGGDEKSTHG
jgi:hypothetical protein